MGKILKREKSVYAGTDHTFDIAIIGGGIHGATLCREAALRGYDALLLEANDYAFGTSSRSSKMIHGGIRYLETLDFQLVREALFERDILLSQAPHLTRVQRFLYPVISGKTRPGWQIRLGMFLYDYLDSLALLIDRRESEFLHHDSLSAISLEAQTLRNYGFSFSKLFSYYDGQMNDTRITIENIVDSENLNATVMNYAQVTKAQYQNSEWSIYWSDRFGKNDHCSRARFLINAAGSFAPEIHTDIFGSDELQKEAVYSRGTHLLFNVPWTLPGLILPTPTKGRYYFVWPFYSVHGKSTLVGTTDREVSKNEFDPAPESDEIEELLGYLKQDLPYSMLKREHLYHAFSGMRVLHRTKNVSSVSAISREHAWIKEKGYLSIIGGKFTTARNTAEEGINIVDKHFKKQSPRRSPSRFRALPGGIDFNLQKNSLRDKITRSLLGGGLGEAQAQELARQCLSRFGSRSNEVFGEKYQEPNSSHHANGLEGILPQIRYAISTEHARTIEDVLSRRLCISLEHGAGLELIPAVKGELRSLLGRDERELDEEEKMYRENHRADI